MIMKKNKLFSILILTTVFLNVGCVLENPKSKTVKEDIDFLKEKIQMLESKNEILKTNIEIQKIKLDSLEKKVQLNNLILIQNAISKNKTIN